MKSKPPVPQIKRIQICKHCGEPFETLCPEIEACPGGCHYKWGNDDPVAWDYDDANRKVQPDD